MKRIIHHIRKQPEGYRRHILHLLTLICAIILVSLWIYSLGNNINNFATKIKESKDLQPLSALKGNIVGGYENIFNSSNPTIPEISTTPNMPNTSPATPATLTQ